MWEGSRRGLEDDPRIWKQYITFAEAVMHEFFGYFRCEAK